MSEMLFDEVDCSSAEKCVHINSTGVVEEPVDDGRSTKENLFDKLYERDRFILMQDKHDKLVFITPLFKAFKKRWDHFRSALSVTINALRTKGVHPYTQKAKGLSMEYRGIYVCTELVYEAIRYCSKEEGAKFLMHMQSVGKKLAPSESTIPFGSTVAESPKTSVVSTVLSSSSSSSTVAEMPSSTLIPTTSITSLNDSKTLFSHLYPYMRELHRLKM